MPALVSSPRSSPGLLPFALVALAFLACPAVAQEPATGPTVILVPAPPPAPVGPTVEILPPATVGPSVEVVGPGCSNCNSGLLGSTLPPPDGPACNCGAAGSECVPGRTKHCYPCEGKTPLGRFLCGLYECICCPDPCYEGRWIPLADTAFFVEAVRPVTQTKLRWDSGNDMILPDRSEFFWARADGMGKGPRPPMGFKGETRLRYNDLWLITEGGNGTISLIVEMPYREIRPEVDAHAAGFGDMTIATKTLLFDCELMQFSLMFKTYMPTGNFTKGLGVGHVSLEPSALVGIKLSPKTYFQGQVSEWIPIGGDPNYQGSILHYHTSINQEICRILPDVPLIATGEFYAYSFQDGAYTDPVLGSFQKSSGYTYAYAGGGLRLFVCDKIDFGFGGSFALSRQHFASQLFRMEFRVRF